VLNLVAAATVATYIAIRHASSLISLLVASGTQSVAHLIGADAPRYTSQFRPHLRSIDFRSEGVARATSLPELFRFYLSLRRGGGLRATQLSIISRLCYGGDLQAPCS
jgi:hypothetical protein